MNRYKGKRFAALLVMAVLLAAGYFLGEPANFNAYSMALGALYGAYLTGQSATDFKGQGGLGDGTR